MKRRDFIQRALHASLAGAAIHSAFGSLRLAQAAALDGLDRAKGTADYKALVCIFLDGGNDNVNTIIPRDAATYAQYQAARPGLALSSAELGPSTHISPLTPQSNGRLYALHPSLSEVRSLFASQRCAIVANVGPLIEPVTRTSYRAGGVQVPPQLFSHQDQQVFWQTSRPDLTNKIGWGGQLADLLRAQNGNQQLSMNLSLAGQNVFQTGNVVQPYSISNQGAERRNGYYGGGNAARRAALDALLAANHAHPLERNVASIQRRSIDLYEQVSAALDAAPALQTPVPVLNNAGANAAGRFNRLIADLRMVAQLIQARTTLDQQRQVFFVNYGGFDFHDRLLADQSDLLRGLSLALQMFYDLTVEMGVEQQVTSFTASDFGRTMTANGDGSDHGWGGEHFVVGGAVNGGDIYGEMPHLVSGGDDDAGWGQIIPKLAVDQYAATLARWFGATEGHIDTILPSLAGTPRFAPATGGFIGSARDLGFMQPG